MRLPENLAETAKIAAQIGVGVMHGAHRGHSAGKLLANVPGVGRLLHAASTVVGGVAGGVEAAKNV